MLRPPGVFTLSCSVLHAQLSHTMVIPFSRITHNQEAQVFQAGSSPGLLRILLLCSGPHLGFCLTPSPSRAHSQGQSKSKFTAP